MQRNKQEIVNGLCSGVEQLFRKYKVDYLKGKGRIASAHTVDVELLKGGNDEISAKNIIIATGSEPASLPGLKYDEKFIISSTGALSSTKVFKNLVIIGAGVIGLELGSVYNRLGTKVEVL